MRRALTGVGLLLSPLAFAACTYTNPPAQVIVQQPAVQAAPAPAETIAPAAPPAAESEIVPPPPQGAGRVAWRPGHWRYTGAAGNPWVWQPGLYVAVPQGQSVWTPGHWAQAPSGGWMWVDGHWA
jgi:hypothetical protein